jgi:hypothetical protein
MAMKRIFILFSVLFVVAAVVWRFGISTQFNQRFPQGWTWKVDSVGQTSWADESGSFVADTTLKDDPINITKRDVAVAGTNADGSVEITDYFATFDAASNTVTWEFTYNASVDPVTGLHTTPEYADSYYLIPRNAEKTTYKVRNSSYQGVPLAFQREEMLAGINTYVYEYRADMDNAAAYPDVKLEDGQKILCFDMQLTYWVEPTTGEIVKYREWCEGDWAVDSAGERLYGLSRWGGENSGDDLIRRSAEVQSMLSNFNLMTLYIPLGLLVAGIACLIMFVYFVRNPSVGKVGQA